MKRKWESSNGADTIDTVLLPKTDADIQSAWMEILIECSRGSTVPKDLVRMILAFLPSVTFATASGLLDDISRLQKVNEEYDLVQYQCQNTQREFNDKRSLDQAKDHGALRERHHKEMDALTTIHNQVVRNDTRKQSTELTYINRKCSDEFGSAWIFLSICLFTHLPYAAACWMARTFRPEDCEFVVLGVRKSEHFLAPENTCKEDQEEISCRFNVDWTTFKRLRFRIRLGSLLNIDTGCLHIHQGYQYSQKTIHACSDCEIVKESVVKESDIRCSSTFLHRLQWMAFPGRTESMKINTHLYFKDVRYIQIFDDKARLQYWMDQFFVNRSRDIPHVVRVIEHLWMSSIVRILSTKMKLWDYTLKELIEKAPTPRKWPVKWGDAWSKQPEQDEIWDFIR